MSPNKYEPEEPRRILRNLIVQALSFTLLYSAYWATVNLQSSVHSENGLGMYSMATVYGAYSISSLFLPPLMLSKLKNKWTILISINGFLVYQLAQFYPIFETLLPAALIVGACGAPLWAAQATYLTTIAEEYAVLTNARSEAVVQRFYGIFFLLFQSSHILGNMISSLTLSRSESSLNTTRNLDLCGVHSCPDVFGKSVPVVLKDVSSVQSTDLSATRLPDSWKLNLLMGIFTACTAGSVLLIYFLVDNLKRYGENENQQGHQKPNRKWNSLLLATIKHWVKPAQILLIPISIWVGIQESLLGAEFSKAYISCAWGVEHIGYVLTTFGICAAISSMLFGKLMGYIGRPLTFLIAASLNFTCLLIMLHMRPSPSEPFMFFVVTGLWGTADGVWSPQLKALYGTTFPCTRDAAFSNLGLWPAVGFIIVFLNANMICMEIKLYAYIGALVFAMGCYGVVEIMAKLGNGKYIIEVVH